MISVEHEALAPFRWERFERVDLVEDRSGAAVLKFRGRVESFVIAPRRSVHDEEMESLFVCRAPDVLDALTHPLATDLGCERPERQHMRAFCEQYGPLWMQESEGTPRAYRVALQEVQHAAVAIWPAVWQWENTDAVLRAFGEDNESKVLEQQSCALFDALKRAIHLDPHAGRVLTTALDNRGQETVLVKARPSSLIEYLWLSLAARIERQEVKRLCGNKDCGNSFTVSHTDRRTLRKQYCSDACKVAVHTYPDKRRGNP